MLSGARVLIITQDQLAAIGLRSILEDCFTPAAVHCGSIVDPARLDRYDYIFLSDDAYLRYHGALSSVHATAIVLSREDHRRDPHRYPLMLWTSQEEARIIEDLERLQRHPRPAAHAKAGTLSSREVEVLKLVAKGQINKQIADALSISLHTVISHRKNITGKLGIKTVAGLTMYAVLNGLVSSKDIG
jgi:DNA-binding NarL/FixJ family response regulator